MSGVKNVLIVYAHQEPKSFNGALKDAAVATLTAQGHNVTVSDLCQMRFDPVGYPNYFKERKNVEHFDLEVELGHAAINKTLPDHIANELRKIQAADLIILQFPMYWFGIPAIMKGWMDVCLPDHVAFDVGQRKWLDDGLFKGKMVLLSTTTGGRAASFTNKGTFSDIDVTLWPLQYSFRYCGFEVLPPQIFYAVQEVSRERRTEMLQAWTKRLENVWTETPLPFVHVKHFYAREHDVLSEEYLQSVKEDKEGPTLGHHLGKRIPPGRKVEL